MSQNPSEDPVALIEIATTVATREEALRLAHALVSQGLAACVQVEPITSVYRWQGQVHEDAEHRLTGKTTAGRYAAAEAALRALHPYQLPAIQAVPVSHASADTAAWVRASVEAPPA
jgi:periplasmic divalent cation tolerance protein